MLGSPGCRRRGSRGDAEADAEADADADADAVISMRRLQRCGTRVAVGAGDSALRLVSDGKNGG